MAKRNPVFLTIGLPVVLAGAMLATPAAAKKKIVVVKSSQHFHAAYAPGLPVISHRKNIMDKLDARSVSALTIYAVTHGYVDIANI